MKITVDIEQEQLDVIMALTGETKKGPAILKAASEYTRKMRLKQFAGMVREGALDNVLEDGYDPDCFEPLGPEN